MNEDQVKGSIHALQWVLKNTSPNKHDREKLYRELDGLEYRLKTMRGEPPSRKDRVQNVQPDEPTERDLAERQAREQRREEIEARLLLLIGKETAQVIQGLTAPQQLTPTPEQMKPIPVKAPEPMPTWEYKEPAYITEPDDFRPLPHFGGRA